VVPPEGIMNNFKLSELVNFWALFIIRYFRKWIWSCPQMRWETTALLGPWERTNLNHWTNHVTITTATEVASKGSQLITHPCTQHSFLSYTLLQTSVKLLEAFLETIFQYSDSALVTSVVTSLVLTNHCPFRTLLSWGNRKKFGSEMSGEYGRCSKAITLCLTRYYSTSSDWYASVLSWRKKLLFHAHFMDVSFSLHIWGKGGFPHTFICLQYTLME
jgi:hypothetical protein